jgi:hypothetical protein
MVPMNRLLRHKSVFSVLASVAAVSLASCGGGSHGSASLPPAAPIATTAPAPYTGPLADATFTITIPGPKTGSAKLRRPSYVSSATKSIKFFINSSTLISGATLTAYNARPQNHFDTGTLPNATCPVSGVNPGDFICTFKLQLPPGTDQTVVTAYDNTGGTGNILSQQTQNLTVVVAAANSFSMVLDANITTPSGSMTVNGNGSCQTGPVGAAFGSVGTSPISFTVAYTDAQNKTIVAPGLPKLQIQGNDAAYHPDSGTINGTGGTVGFTINQATQSFTLTPSNSSTTNASVNVKAVQADSNVGSGGPADGLAFAKTKTFAFSTGPAPPAHNFLAAVEQLTLASGQVDLYNVSLGGNTPGSDTFSAFSPATLAVTASTNEAGVNDVDNPQDLRWDTTGDLLIANGGGAPGDNGNVACVPLGAIATGANSATTVSTNAFDPISLGYDSRNGTLAVANQPVSAPKQLAEYVLSGNYTASTNNLTAPGFGSLGGVTEMPSLAAGTFAITLTTGAEEDPAHAGTTGTNKVAIFSPTGVETDISDDTSFSIDAPWGIAWDNADSQLVIANNSVFHKLLSFYSVSGTPALQKTVNTTFKNTLTAASPDGHVAVAWVKQFGYMQVQIYANHPGATAPTPVFGPIPYNGTTTSCGSTYIYGNGTTIVNALRWLSNTKLLVAVQSNNAGTPTALNGFYVYDITNSAVPAGFDDITCSAFAAAPVNTGFVHVNNKPLSAAFKP